MSLEEHHRFILNCMDRQTDIARKLIEELEGRNAALAAENERLKQPWVKILTESETWNALSEVARLTAEVEWLRKADRLVCWNPTTQQWEVRHEALK